MTSDELSAIHGFQNYQHPDRFGQLLGYEIAGFDRASRTAKVALTFRGEHLSLAGRVHGGVVSSLLDFACGLAACTTIGPADMLATVELKVNFFHPLLEGERAEADARVEFRGKKLCVLSARLHRQGSAEPVAMATATFNIIEG